MGLLLGVGLLALLLVMIRLRRVLIGTGVGPALMAILATAFTVAMVFYPAAAFHSAVQGLKLWWEIVFPALLPFFIGAEILIGLGVVHYMGVLLEPLMRPLFHVPGAGSFVMAVGLASGFPIGSVLTARLRREGMCTKTEAERLMSFTNTADPLFMSGAVAVGMFGQPALAAVIMAAHYLSSISVGLVMRFHARGRDRPEPAHRRGNVLGRAFRALVEARHKDARPIGRLFGDAVRNSVNTLLLIGGFIIMFSVIINIMANIGAVRLLSRFLAVVLLPLGVHPAALTALTAGIFEVTLGCQLAAQVAAPLTQQVMAAGAVIAWSGLSVHGQVAAIIQDTDISIGPYIVARIVHAFLAGAYTIVLMNSSVLAALARALPVTPPAGVWDLAWRSTLTMAAITAAMVALPFVYYLPSSWSGFRVRRR